MQQEHNLYARDELCRMLVAALTKKKPLPPENWSVAGLDEEVYRAGSDFEPNLFLRHSDALATCVFYLVDFARRMPEWIDLSTANARVREMCGDLADEIERITYEPEAVIAERGKLKAWLNAKLAVQSCLIYTEETTRVITEKAEATRLGRTARPAAKMSPEKESRPDKWQSDLARSIFQKVSGKSTENSSPQPSLF